jgi:hypothetical protein
MIVRADDFIPRTHPLLLDPEAPEEFKRHFQETGMAPTLNKVECLEIVDDCFHCGEKLTTPYVYWQGDPGSISLHQKCALKLILGLTQDAYELANFSAIASKREAIQWLNTLAKP